MQIENILYIVLAGIVALLLALFQYVYKSKMPFNRKILFTFLRFVTLFSILLLLINPKFNQETLYNEKPNLVIAVDNSSSISHLNQNTFVTSFLKQVTLNQALNTKFNIETFSFGNTLRKTDSLSFLDTQTNIDGALSNLTSIYKDQIAPVVLLTDGNQTYGTDYEFNTSNYKHPVYPLVLGDTTQYFDLKIQQLNVNKYAYLKNKFPVEAIVSYNGNTPISTTLTVKNGNTTVFSKNVQLSKNNNSKIINFTLPANTVGVASYRTSVTRLKNEKNTANNTKVFAVEVISQKTKIAVVSTFSHPDLGALKNSIESNEQREVVFLKPKEAVSKLKEFQLFIIYQPNKSFKPLLDLLKQENKNTFTVIGPKTDLNFVNTNTKDYQYEITRQFEAYQAQFNSNYTPFSLEDIAFETFPPLESHFGSVNFTAPYQTILNKKLGAVITDAPLLTTYEINNRKLAVLFGENIWKWRLQSHINSKSFEAFDDFTGKIIQYLASNKKRNRLSIEHESFYNQNSNIVIKASYFDKNYEFDKRSSLNITIIDAINKSKKVIPLILNSNTFQVDLSDLKPSKYRFTVNVDGENISKSGRFEVLEYHVEQQFLNANVAKLNALGNQTKGQAFLADKSEKLIDTLLSDNRFVTKQKSNKNSLPLVDWKYLLGLIALSLAIEWFLRKYNGLI